MEEISAEHLAWGGLMYSVTLTNHFSMLHRANQEIKNKGSLTWDMTKDYVQKGGALLKEIAAELSIGSLPYFLEGGTFREDVSRSEMLRTINNFTW